VMAMQSGLLHHDMLVLGMFNFKVAAVEFNST
jgi:hypothetical protein